MPLMSGGYVYLITNPAWPGYTKIGKATNLEGRLATFQTHAPFRDFELRYARQFADPCAAENAMKGQFAGLRVKGTEWFQVHHEDARGYLVKLKEN